MATIKYEGTCCECCALLVANGDDSGCRDYYGHTHPQPMPEKITSGHAVISGEESEVIVGPCELCGQGGGGYMDGWSFAIIE